MRVRGAAADARVLRVELHVIVPELKHGAKVEEPVRRKDENDKDHEQSIEDHGNGIINKNAMAHEPPVELHLNLPATTPLPANLSGEASNVSPMNQHQP